MTVLPADLPVSSLAVPGTDVGTAGNDEEEDAEAVEGDCVGNFFSFARLFCWPRNALVAVIRRMRSAAVVACSCSTLDLTT
jgi:hypothetical protein